MYTVASPETGECPELTDSGIFWPSTPPCDYSIQRCKRKSDEDAGMQFNQAINTTKTVLCM